MNDARRPDRVLSLGLVVLLLAVGLVSFDRARRGEFDFSHFYHDAQYVWKHGALPPSTPPDAAESQRLPFYLPVVPLLIAPLTAGGPEAAALLWAAMQVAALGYSSRVLRRWAAAPAGTEPGRHNAVAVFGLAVVLVLPAVFEAAKFNQLSFAVMALVLAGLSALETGRQWRAGAFLGVAAVLKLLPAIFLIWLLLKRRWTASLAFATTVVLVSIVPCVVAFGPARTLDYHRQWWTYNAAGDAARGLVNPELREHFLDHRNQSIAAVIARLTQPDHKYRMAWQPLQLDPDASNALTLTVSVLLLLMLMWLTERPWRQISAGQRRIEAATYAVAMAVLSPLLRTYYYVWALPALVLLVGMASAAPPRPDGVPLLSSSGSRRAPAVTGLLVWVIGMAAWLWPAARSVGVHLIMLILIGALLLAATRSSRSARASLSNAPSA